MNAIELLKKDHQKVAGLFKQYEKAGDSASAKKEEFFGRIRQELDIHARIEEEIFYPAARQAPAEEAKELVNEAGEEHKQIKMLLAELEGMDADDEQFDAKMKVLKEDVEHHVEEEENELFPKVKKGLGSERLEDLGRQLEYRRQSAPARAPGPAPAPDRVAALVAARAAARGAAPVRAPGRVRGRARAAGRAADPADARAPWAPVPWAPARGLAAARAARANGRRRVLASASTPLIRDANC